MPGIDLKSLVCIQVLRAQARLTTFYGAFGLEKFRFVSVCSLMFKVILIVMVKYVPLKLRLDFFKKIEFIKLETLPLLPEVSHPLL